MFKAVLFDHDGTLVDSEQVHFRMWQQALADYDVEVTPELYESGFLGVPGDESALMLARTFSLDVDPNALLAEKERLTKAFLQREPFPAIAYSSELITCVAARVPTGIVSGSRLAFVGASVAAYGWAESLSVIVSADDVSANKPSPEGYLKGAAVLGVTPSSIAVIEDTYTGLTAAAEAGMQVIAVRSAFNASHDFSRAAVVVESLAQAWEWLDERLPN